MVPTKAKVRFARFKDAVNVEHHPTFHVPHHRHQERISLYVDEHFLYIEVTGDVNPGLVMVPMSNISQIDLTVIAEEPDPKTKKPAPKPKVEMLKKVG